MAFALRAGEGVLMYRNRKGEGFNKSGREGGRRYHVGVSTHRVHRSGR